MQPANRDGGLTVGEASSRVGVTVRTLHHWDEIGIASPSLRSHAGYRLYSSADVSVMQRVLIYRALGLPLGQIRDLLTATTDTVGPLREQRELLDERIAELEKMRGGLDRLIQAQERGILLSSEQQVAIFGPDWNPEWMSEARQQWGDTAEWAQYTERSSQRGPDEWSTIARATTAVDEELAQTARAGIDPASAEASALIDRHREAFSAYFPITVEMHVCLGRMYEGDPDFAAHYERLQPGLTSWLRQSIDASARAAGIDPDTAEWR